MGIFDNLRQRIAPRRRKERKLPNVLITGELGEAGTSNSSGFISEDFNSKFNDSKAIDAYDEMRKTDATVSATLKALKLPILAAGRLILPASDDTKDKEIAEFVRFNLFEHLEGGFDSFLREGLAHLEFGFYYFEKVFEVVGGQILLRKLAARLPSAHFRWIMQTHPEIPGITQQLPTVTPEQMLSGKFLSNPEIPRSKLILFTNNREGDNWAGISVLRSAYIHWYFKNKLYRLDGIKHERGAGILRIKLPENSSDEDKTAAAELGKNFKLNESAYIVAPNPDWEIELMTNGIADQTTGLGNSVKHHDHEIEKNILAQFLGLSDGDTGSFALSKDQSSFFLLGLKQKAKYMAEVINEELIKELVDLNFGKQEKYPKLVFTRIGAVDFAELSTALKTLSETGIIDIDDELKVWARETFDLPEVTLEEVQAASEEREEKEAEELENEMERLKQEEEPEEEDQELAEVKKKRFKPFRELTLAEARVRFAEMKTFFDGTEDKIKRMLDEITAKQQEKFIRQAVILIAAGNLNALRKLTLSFNSTLIRDLKAASKKALEEGKKTAAREMGVSIPTTPNRDVQVMNARVEQAIEDRTREIEANVKNKGIDLARKGVGAAAIAFALRKAFDKGANVHNSQLTGRTVASNINAGRSLVLNKNQGDIHALQRSEILDEKTCAMCLSIDGRIVEKDDPFANIDQVHTHCRGIWVAILKTDADLPTPKPIPKSISSRFETVDGVPTANEFKQLKKPIIGKSSRVQERIDKGTIENPNLEK